MTLKEFREQTKDMPEDTVLIVGEERWGDFDSYKVRSVEFDSSNSGYFYTKEPTPTLCLTTD